MRMSLLSVIHIWCSVTNLSNCNCSKISQEVSICLKTDSIMFILNISHSLSLLSWQWFPNGILIAPWTFCLCPSPGVSKFNQSLNFSIDLSLEHAHYSISVTKHHPREKLVGIRTRLTWSDHWKLLSSCTHQVSPRILGIKPFLLKPKHFNMSSSEIVQSLFRISSLNVFVTSIQLCPSFFKKHNP